MKKNLAKKVTLSILAGAVLMSSSVVWAADITDGTKVLWTDETYGYLRNETLNPDGTVPNGDYNKRFYGAYESGNNNVIHGKVKITGGSVSGYNIRVYGGHSSSGDATDNEVTITGGTFGATGSNIAIYGGNSNADGVATRNKVDISGEGTKVYADVYGGMSNGSDPTEGNTVTIKGGTFGGNVYGGYSLSIGAVATDNTVTISGGEFSDANKNIYGGYSKGGNVNNNKVEISDGTFGDASNEVSIYGGYGFTEGSDANASGNTVTISDGTFNNASVQGGSAHNGGDANNNIVTIKGGTFKKAAVYGGYTINSSGNTNNNTVTIVDGTFGDENNYVSIYGGYSTSGNATSNTVNISGDANLENANLYGGYGFDVEADGFVAKYGGAGAPNTLNIGWDGTAVKPWSGNNTGKVQRIAGFDVINFHHIDWVDGGNVVETETLELKDTKVDKVVIGGGTVKNSESMNLITATASTNPISGTYTSQQDKDIIIRTGLTTSVTVKGDIVLDGNNVKLTIDYDGIATEGIVAKVTDSSTDTGGVEPGVTIPDTGISGGTNVPTGATSFVDAVDKAGENTVAYKVLDAVYANYTTDEEQKKAVTNMLQLGEAGGQSATAANISRNVSAATVNRMSFGGRGGVRHRGGHGPADFNEKDGTAVWAQYVHGKDKVDGMALADGVTTSYESQFNGVVLGVDFKEVGKYQSGIAFNYGEGDSHTKNIALSRSDYDFWGIGYYGAVKNADSNVIFDINYAKSDSEVKQFNSGVELEAEPETTTISAGVKVEKLIDRGAMQFVPYAGLRFMSVDTDEYSANYLGKEAFNYSADRQNIWLLPVGVSFRQENVYDSGWVVTPKVDLSYIWAFGDTENEMTVRTPDVAEAARLGYTVMNDGSFLGSIGLEAEKGDWTFGVAYSYQKGDHSESKKWYVDVNYSF